MALCLDSFVVHFMDFHMRQGIAVGNMADNSVVHEKEVVSTLVTDRLNKTIYILSNHSFKH